MMIRPLLLMCLLAACSQPKGMPAKATQFDNQTGAIEVVVCGRGCRQYLLTANGVAYSPKNLPIDFQVDQASVKFSGELQADSTLLNTFGPADQLIPYKKVRNLNITHIVKQ